MAWKPTGRPTVRQAREKWEGTPDMRLMPFLLRATSRLDLAGWTLRSEVNHDGDRAFGRHTRPDPERYEYLVACA